MGVLICDDFCRLHQGTAQDLNDKLKKSVQQHAVSVVSNAEIITYCYLAYLNWGCLTKPVSHCNAHRTVCWMRYAPSSYPEGS